jgi:hypothetical protein
MLPKSLSRCGRHTAGDVCGRLRGLAAASGFAPLGISEAFHPAVILSIQNQISSAEATDIAAVLLCSPFWPIGRGT